MKTFSFILFLFLVGCHSAPILLHPNTQHVTTQAEKIGFSPKRYATKTFLLTTYEKSPMTPATTIHVYIEGDGNSWKTKYKLSDNPTPHQPLALKLALRDQHSHVVYLARPCQYTPLNLDLHCSNKFWSSHRYAPEVIASMNEVLDQLKEKSKNSNFVLIGFSGGASVATLIAAQRKDISGLITVAGDLNHEKLNQFHKTTPLNGSLNPSNVAHLVKDLPQHHWNGSRDKIIPTWVAEDFARKVNNPACVKVTTLKGVSHHKGWEERWEEIMKEPVSCSLSHFGRGLG